MPRHEVTAFLSLRDAAELVLGDASRLQEAAEILNVPTDWPGFSPGSVLEWGEENEPEPVPPAYSRGLYGWPTDDANPRGLDSGGDE